MIEPERRWFQAVAVYGDRQDMPLYFFNTELPQDDLPEIKDTSFVEWHVSPISSPPRWWIEAQIAEWEAARELAIRAIENAEASIALLNTFLAEDEPCLN